MTTGRSGRRPEAARILGRSMVIKELLTAVDRVAGTSTETKSVTRAEAQR
jgi:hypothetical protein